MISIWTRLKFCCTGKGSVKGTGGSYWKAGSVFTNQSCLLFPKQQILDSPKLKEFSDDHFDVDVKVRKVF